MKKNNKMLKIEEKEVVVKEWKGQRVVTFKDIDLLHGRTDGTARRSFNENKKKFIENEDYYYLTPENIKTNEIRTIGITSPRGGYLITESGYLMLVKSFTDDLSWKVQRQLVNCYFSKKTSIPKHMSLAEESKMHRDMLISGELKLSSFEALRKSIQFSAKIDGAEKAIEVCDSNSELIEAMVKVIEENSEGDSAKFKATDFCKLLASKDEKFKSRVIAANCLSGMLNKGLISDFFNFEIKRTKNGNFWCFSKI